MLTRIHMQDQIHNRIEDFTNEKEKHDWDEIFQNVATISIVVLFLAMGIGWS